MESVLLVDDDRCFREVVVGGLVARGCHVVCVGDGQAAARKMNVQKFTHVVLEPSVPGGLWFSCLRDLFPADSRRRWVVVTAFPALAMAAAARRLGARGFFAKPCDVGDVVQTLFGAPNLRSFQMLCVSPHRLAAVEWEHINAALAENQGNVSRTARALGIPRQTLYRKLRTHPPFAYKTVERP